MAAMRSTVSPSRRRGTAALGAALAHGRHEVDGLALAATRRCADATLCLDVVDAARTGGRREVRGGDGARCLLVLVLAQPAGLVVDRRHRAGERVERPGSLALPATGVEEEEHGPGALVGAT